jgi:hypothetical protein
MTAVDQAGNKVARYRYPSAQSRMRDTPEIAVHPGQRLTDELALALAVSAHWLRPYFSTGRGGG